VKPLGEFTAGLGNVNNGATFGEQRALRVARRPIGDECEAITQDVVESLSARTQGIGAKSSGQLT
jgi:hypothetical protein